MNKEKSFFKKIDAANVSMIFKQLEPYLGLVLVIIIFQIVTGGALLTSKNMKLLVNQSFIIMCGAMGTSFVLAQGNLDFSLGGIVGVSATLGVMAANAMGPIPSLIVALLVGTAIGGFVGLVHVVFKVPAFIATICMMFILRGATWILNDYGSIMMPSSMTSLDTFNNKLYVIIGVFVVVFILFEYTKLGKYSVAIGSNPLAARASGVPVDKMRALAYVVSGLFGGFCGFLSMVRAGSTEVNTGTMFEVNVLTALVLGGMSLSGGSGVKVKAGILGAIMLAIIRNGMVLWGVNDKFQEAVTGIILIAAVAISYERKNVIVID